MKKCVVLGSFRRYYRDIAAIVDLFQKAGLEVLSPVASTVINPGAEFVLLQSDLDRWSDIDFKCIEDRVLQMIPQSDFVYVCDPEGYIGLTTSFEIGYARAKGIPVFSMCLVSDQTIRQYVDQVLSVQELIDYVLSKNHETRSEGGRQC